MPDAPNSTTGDGLAPLDVCSHGRPDHQEMLRRLCEALGMSTAARPYSPAQLFNECLTEAARLRARACICVRGSDGPDESCPVHGRPRCPSRSKQGTACILAPGHGVRCAGPLVDGVHERWGVPEGAGLCFDNHEHDDIPDRATTREDVRSVLEAVIDEDCTTEAFLSAEKALWGLLDADPREVVFQGDLIDWEVGEPTTLVIEGAWFTPPAEAMGRRVQVLADPAGDTDEDPDDDAAAGHHDEAMVDLGGGMVVPLREVLDP